MNQRTSTISGMIVLAALARIMPHPWNFTPLTAMALFAGAQFREKWLAFTILFGALFLSDLLLGLYKSMPVIYGTFAVIVCIGATLQNHRKLLPIASAALISSVLFFVITNFGVWASEHLYPKSWSGLLLCYAAGIPFFQNTLMGDAFYTALLFGSFSFAERRFSILKENPALAQ